MIVLDASVLIGFLDAADAQHPAAVELLQRRFGDGFATSVLTLAEVLVHPTRNSRQDAAGEALAAIGVQVLPLTASDAAALARVRNDYHVRMPDAVALYAAMSTRSELATFDDALAAAAGRAGIRIAR